MERASRKTWALRVLGVGLGLLALCLVVIRLSYGGGDPYPDGTQDPVLGASEVIQIGELPFPAGNVTASPEGRVFVNIHPFVQADRFTDAFLFELVDGTPVPYPDAATQPALRHVFGMTVGPRNRLWLTSPATLDRERTRLIAIDLASGRIVVDHRFDEGVARFAQDLRVTPDGRTMLLADTGAFRFTAASLLVVDLDTMGVHSLLSGHPSTQPQDWMIRTPEGEHTIAGGLITFSVGVDGIALSPDGTELYFAAMSHDTLFRIPMEAVLDANLTAAQHAARLTAVASKPLSDGIETTTSGEVLVTDIEHGAIVGIQPDGTRRTLVRLGDRIGWADGVTVGPGGRVYFTDSQIPRYLDPWLQPPDREVLDTSAPHTAVYSFVLPN
ncbi:MAG: SMP-30/gluconolactonase/LRE family protein [Sandaracinaceae bacterium]